MKKEYNPPTSVRQLTELKMYAELTGIELLELRDKKPLG